MNERGEVFIGVTMHDKSVIHYAFQTRGRAFRPGFEGWSLPDATGWQKRLDTDANIDYDVRLAEREMSDAWLAFARTGNPNTSGLPQWPTYDATRRATMVFDRHVRVVDDPRGDQRRMFARVPYVQPGT